MLWIWFKMLLKIDNYQKIILIFIKKLLKLYNIKSIKTLFFWAALFFAGPLLFVALIPNPDAAKRVHVAVTSRAPVDVTDKLSSPQSAHGAITMIPSTYLRFALHTQPNTGPKGCLERGTRRALGLEPLSLLVGVNIRAGILPLAS